MSEATKNLQAVWFAAILSVICCTLITAASVGLKPLQLENMRVDRQKNILLAAGIVDRDASLSKSEIGSLFNQSIRTIHVDNEGQPVPAGSEGNLTLYLYEKDSRIQAYIVPIESRGLWGKILGYMAFERDGKTVAGFTVYNHAETPGLGGEIEKAWFQKNFVGKTIVSREGAFVAVGIAKGSAQTLPEETRAHTVDGISGATLTGKYLSQGLKENLERYEPVSVKFRQDNQQLYTTGTGNEEETR